MLTPAAADAGLLWLLVIAAMGAFVLFGAALYYDSAARRRDITGSTSSAWRRFVPFANLWLMLKRGEMHDTETESHSRVSRFVLDPLAVIGAVFVLALTQTIDKALEGTAYYDASDSKVLSNLLVATQTLEDSFAMEARLSSASPQIRIDEIMLLSEIETEGSALHITYDVERDSAGFRPDFEATLAEMKCAPEMFGGDIARGGEAPSSGGTHPRGACGGLGEVRESGLHRGLLRLEA